MNSAQDLSTAVKSVVNGFRPVDESISLDISKSSQVDILLTFALATRSLDQAAAAFERVLELDSDNEVANAGFTWLLGVRDAAERLEQASEAAADGEKADADAQPDDAASVTSDDSVDSDGSASDSFSADDVSSEATASAGSGFSADLPFAFQQVVEPLIASNDQADNCEAVAQAEKAEKEKAEAEAAAEAEQAEKERAEAEAAAEAEKAEKERAEAEAAAEAEKAEKERAEAEAAAEAEKAEKERAEAEAAAEAEKAEKERAEAEAAAEAEKAEKERAEAEAAAEAEKAEKERAEVEAAAEAEKAEKERAEAEAAAEAEKAEKERAEVEAAKQVEQEEAIVAEVDELADEVHVAAAAKEQDEAPVAPIQVPRAAGEKLTILTVDDSPTIRKLLMMTLEREGFNVVQAQDGVEALVKMSECNPAMILSDINMPRLDGYKLCKFVKKHAKTKHIPVIMLSGKDGVFDKLRGRMSGCDGYLTKPFESKDLLEKINSFVGANV